MTNSRIKQAIDEAIGKDPLLNDTFVEKVLTKKKTRKSLQWIQPAIILCTMLVLGFTLYFLPAENIQTAEEVEPSLPTEEQRIVVENYFDAIYRKDVKAIQKVANVDVEMVLKEYSIFDLEQPFEIVKTIDEEQRIVLYIKLTANERDFLNEIQYVKATGKIELNEQQLFYAYDDIELPRSIDLEFRTVDNAPKMLNFELKSKQQAYEKGIFADGTILHQLKDEEGTLRVMETMEGEFLDIGIFSDGPSATYTMSSGSGGYLIIDEKGMNITLLFKQTTGNYQIVYGDLQDRKDARKEGPYQIDFHDEPVYFWGGQDAKIVTVRDGELVSANIFEHAKLNGPIPFYSVDMRGPNVLLKYDDNYFQKSNYYLLEGFNQLSTSELHFDAKKNNLQNRVFINRANYYNQYEFYGNDLKIKLAPKDVGANGKSEQIYTNIKIRVDGENYFVTGDSGFAVQFTRKDDRTIVDEQGNEYYTDGKLN
ncbi:hypothetical protein [Solibacillus sp. FSL K6-1523]|uniref:hypothetical protein n=1 Tax=Solibacillus sp. FSL K6-1523 TaxID=2921471 RepID=UPI0030F55D8E